MILTQTPPVAPDIAEDVERYLWIRSMLARPQAPAPGLDDVAAARDHLARVVGPVLSQDHLAFFSPIADVHVGLARRDGRAHRLSISPGVVAARTIDLVRAEQSSERARAACTATADVAALSYVHPEAFPEVELPPARVITAWSPKSRARMVRALAELDYSAWEDVDGDLGMVTLTLPGDWLAVAPTGPEFKRLVRAFRARWERSIGPLMGTWKLEFQRRGAPHLHMLVKVPALVSGVPFEDWLSRTWASVCGADDSYCHGCKITSCSCSTPDTERARHLSAGTGVDFDTRQFNDPRRIALYFLGHSSKTSDGKEYQHRVPEAWTGDGTGPGRFWGYWNLDRAALEVDLDAREWYMVRRVLRKIAAAREATARRAAASHGTVRPVRQVRSLGHRGGAAGGWVLVNDGIALAYDLARYIASIRTDQRDDHDPRD